jgi:exopolysaccharide production protein ExoQ
VSSITKPFIEIRDRGLAIKVNGISVYPLLLRILIILIVFGANIDLPRIDRAIDAHKTGPQSLIKFAVLLFGGALGAWGWWRNPLTRRLFISIPGSLLLVILAFHLPACIGAVAPTIAFSSGIAFFCTLLLAAAALTHLGTRCVLFDILFGLFLYIIGCFFAYIIIPDLATFYEVLSSTQTVQRIGGLGHPNILGRTAVFCLVFLFSACYGRLIRWRWFWFWFPVLIIAATVSLSRTPVVGGIVALGAVCLPLLRRPRVLYISGVFLALCTLGLILVEGTIGTDKMLDKFVYASTKTGDVDELTSGTGRTRIWWEAIQHAKQRPIFGHGAGASPIVMVGFSGHAHNVFLDVAINLGFPAAIVTLCLMLYNLYAGVVSRVPLLVSTSVFLFVVSLAERPLFSPIPDSMTLIWMLTTLWPVYLHIVPDEYAQTPDVSLRPLDADIPGQKSPPIS